MKTLYTDNTAVIVLSRDDMQTIVDSVKGTTVAPGKMLEWLVAQYSANLRQDTSDLVTYMDESGKN